MAAFEYDNEALFKRIMEGHVCKQNIANTINIPHVFYILVVIGPIFDNVTEPLSRM